MKENYPELYLAVRWALLKAPNATEASVEATILQAGAPRALSLAAETAFTYNRTAIGSEPHTTLIREALIMLNAHGLLPRPK